MLPLNQKLAGSVALHLSFDDAVNFVLIVTTAVVLIRNRAATLATFRRFTFGRLRELPWDFDVVLKIFELIQRSNQLIRIPSHLLVVFVQNIGTSERAVGLPSVLIGRIIFPTDLVSEFSVMEAMGDDGFNLEEKNYFIYVSVEFHPQALKLLVGIFEIPTYFVFLFRFIIRFNWIFGKRDVGLLSAFLRFCFL